MNLKQNLNIKRLIFILLFLFIKSVSYSIDPDKVPPLIPYWAFGHWIWEDERNTSDAVTELTQAYFDHQIPVDALIIDSPWMVQYNDFIWDTNRYPQAQQMVEDLQSKGIKDQLKNIYLSANYGFSGIACEIGGYWKIPSTKEQFIVDEENGSIKVDSERKLDVVFLVKQQVKPRKVKGADAYTYIEENKMLRIDKSGTNFQLKIQ